jgi:hypothetical protein
MEEILASIRKIIADDPSKAAAQGAKAPASDASSASSMGKAKPAASSSIGAVSKPALPRLTGPSPDSSPSFGLSAQPPAKPTFSAPEAPAASAAPFGSAPAAPADGGRPSPSFGRLSEALRSTFATSGDDAGPSFSSLSAGPRLGEAPPTPLSTPPSRRPVYDAPSIAVFEATERSRTIETELDDILNEPLASGGGASPGKPSGGEAGGQWAVWRTSPGKPDDASGTPAEASSTSMGTGKPAPSPPSLGRSGGGFFPPAPRIEPTLSSAPPPSASGGFGQDKRDGSNDSDGSHFGPKPPAAPITTKGELPAVERPSSKPGPVVIAAMPPMSGGQSDRASGGMAMSSPPSTQIATRPGATAVPEATAPRPTSTDARPTPATPPSAATPDAASPSAGTVSVPLPPRTTLFSRPFTASKPDIATGPVAGSPVPPADRPRVATPEAILQSARMLERSASSMAAPSSPLDALAAGLAASNAHSGPPQVPVASGPLSPGASVPRSLEDSVADMIKPMLQKWIDDNMPRIIEKALRNETGGGGKPPQS